ncbi:MAG TPA: cell division protein FtsQ/DivIB [Symbiobacteriaceae bacterium]|jgi:cell division septal protein FtsQ
MTDQPLGGERRRAAPRKRTGGWFVLTALVFICLCALYFSPLFRLAAVDITGRSRLSRERVMEIAGLKPGLSRFERPAADIAARLNQEPWVKTAAAVWQGNQVQVSLTEREPVGLIRYYDLYYLALDETGAILQETTLDVEKGLPVVSGVFVTKGLRGRQLPHPGLLDGLTVLSRMAPALRAQVSEVHVDPDRSLTLYMTGGPTVLWGPVPDGKEREALTKQKLEMFGGVWLAVKKRATTCRIDMRVDGLGIPSGCQ